MPVTQHAQGTAPGGLPLSAWELLSKSGENSSGNDGVRPDGHPCVIKCNLMRSRVTDLGAELFKQHAKKKKKKIFKHTGDGIKAACVILWWKNTPKKGGLRPEERPLKQQGKGWGTATKWRDTGEEQAHLGQDRKSGSWRVNNFSILGFISF